MSSTLAHLLRLALTSDEVPSGKRQQEQERSSTAGARTERAFSSPRQNAVQQLKFRYAGVCSTCPGALEKLKFRSDGQVGEVRPVQVLRMAQHATPCVEQSVEVSELSLNASVWLLITMIDSSVVDHMSRLSENGPVRR